MEIFEHLEPVLRAFWFVAIPTSLIFAIQSILTFVGMHSSDGLDADFHVDIGDTDSSFQLFSLRNLINFLLGFSWTGIAFYAVISNKPTLILISLIVGVLFVYVFFIIIRQVQKLAEDNSFKLIYTLNTKAKVYLTIPEKKSGIGKILISVNGSFHELDAMTEHESIPTGDFAKIVKIENNNILIVETIK